jgi:hypothetical protein
MMERLADEHAIERVAVESGKLDKSRDALLIQNQIGDSMARQVRLG